jgi:hypothetical protein
VDRFHLEGVDAGTAVRVYALGATGERGELLAQAASGDGGWVTLAAPLVVSPDRGFVAVVG